MRRRRTRWMTTLLAGTMSLATTCALMPALAQDAPPPVPPPVGENTPIPPPPAQGLAPPAPAPDPTTKPTEPKPPAATPTDLAPTPAPVAEPKPTPAPEPAPEVKPAAPEPVPAPEVKPTPEVKPAPEATPAPEVKPETPAEPMPEAPAAPVAESPATAPATTEPVAAQPGQPAAPQPPAEADPVNPALAERLTSMATGLLRSQPPSNAVWRYATSLLQAANRLAPEEPRFARFLIEAAGRAGDQDTVLRTLEAYRKLEPNDHYAQAQLIDAYLAKMQISEARVAYLKNIIESAQVAPPVRSFAAMRLASAYSERMQDEAAAEAVNLALQLNFLNLDALRVRNAHAQQVGAAPDRLAALLAMLQSNPAQPQVGFGVARELADVGLVQRSLEWFKQSLELQARMGMPPPPDVGVDFASELFISGEGRAAAQIVDQITRQDPDELNAWLLKLTLARSAGDKELLATTSRQATVALTNRMATLRQQAGDSAATTRPVDAEGEATLPDPIADLQFIGGAKPEMTGAYATVASGLAWLKIYFEEKPVVAQPYIKAAASVMGEGSEIVARLQGWSFLIAGNNDDATTKLSAVADKDPIAALGLIRMAKSDPASQQKAAEDARKLLQRQPSRLTGAFVMEGLGKRAVKVQPTPGAADIEKVLATFPKDWMKVIDQPQQFYALRLEPVTGRVSVPVGEPVLVQVSIYNVSEYPLTMGPEGVIHPDIWLDAQTRGVQQQVFPAEAFARLAGPMVIAPKQSISQVIRLDQGQLLSTLERFPTANFQISALAMSNPTTVNGQVGPGSSGQRVQLSKLMERRGSPIGQPDVSQKLGQAIQSGTAAEKVRAAETLTKFATLLTGEGAGDQAKALGYQAAEAVRVTTNDADPTVRAWATYLYSVYSGDSQSLTRLVHDPSWVARTLGIVAVDYTGQKHDIFKDLAESDPEPLVKNLAAAALEAKIARPTSQPAGPAAAPPVPATQP